jgi:hypothetical protein
VLLVCDERIEDGSPEGDAAVQAASCKAQVRDAAMLL